MKLIDIVRRVESRLGNRVMGHGVYKQVCCVCTGSEGELHTRYDGVCAHLECLMKGDI